MYSTIAEFINEWNEESAMTQKILDTLTDQSIQQQVTSEGRTLGQIAWHIVTVIPGFLSNFGVSVENAKDLATIPTAQQMSEIFSKISANAALAIKQQWTDDSLKQVQNAFGRDLPNTVILSLLIKHNIHHRGQMTVLMRQAGLMVPGVYGPAKEEWSRMGMEAPAF